MAIDGQGSVLNCMEMSLMLERRIAGHREDVSTDLCYVPEALEPGKFVFHDQDENIVEDFMDIYGAVRLRR
jgi:hypothetical protein